MTRGFVVRLDQLLSSSDPETGWAIRLLGTALLIANLILARPGEPAVVGWTVLIVGFLAWVFAALLDGRLGWQSVVALALSAALPTVLLGPSPDSTASLAVFIPFAVFAAHLRVRVALVIAVAVLMAAIGCASLLTYHRGPVEIVSDFVVLLILTAFGLARRRYRLRAEQTRELLEQTRLAQREQARAAALDERARIAREMHDVLAHSLGALSVQLDVAEGLLSEKRDVEGALARVRRSRRLAVEGLAEARAAVAALRADIPPLRDALTELTDAYQRDHDVEATFQVTGPHRALSPAAEVSLLRTAREALTNAAKHAPGSPVSMALDYTEESIRLSVRNIAAAVPPPTTVNGFGLAGMRERVALVGGTLSAGRDDGSWLVVAEVPAT
ncbi:hypothetical protein GCM10009765_30870 [Fodinicola feengrottensis]|uniref:histidine kinase n=1 Tax=Fodinicola feengrottensis TaxID=435914 RepID=A0ABN2GZY2_9ACTN